MAKTYLSTVKYLVRIEFSIEGVVDKHDIIGAIFGQSEGLMGEDLDLKELQKNGKLGRIEVDARAHSGKTSGLITIPSGMDKVKTSILAAAIESVDKVGPCSSIFKTVAIDDTRGEKRKAVTERAKELLQKMSETMPESTELAEEIVGGLRGAMLQEYGKERLPAGPDIEKSDELIIVEGRADVINLLRHGIRNCIAINGANMPETMIGLSKQKTTTAFVDGDRGGDLIARQLSQLAKIDSIAKAPAGKEVEELTLKEILAALKKKRSLGDLARGYKPLFQRQRGYRESAGRESSRGFKPRSRGGRRFKPGGTGRNRQMRGRDFLFRHKEEEMPAMLQKPNDLGEFNQPMQELNNTLKARFLDEKGKAVKEVSVRDLLEEMQRQRNAHAVVFDGIVTKRLLEQAEKTGIKCLVGMKKGKIEETGKVKVVTLY